MATRQEAGKAIAKKLKTQDPDHFKKIGSKGGVSSNTGGFAYLAEVDPEQFKAVSAKGGSVSRRRPKSGLVNA